MLCEIGRFQIRLDSPIQGQASLSIPYNAPLSHHVNTALLTANLRNKKRKLIVKYGPKLVRSFPHTFYR